MDMGDLDLCGSAETQNTAWIKMELYPTLENNFHRTFHNALRYDSHRRNTAHDLESENNDLFRSSITKSITGSVVFRLVAPGTSI